MRTLFLDCGHSPKFPGASGFKAENLWNRSVVAELTPLVDPKKWTVCLVPDSYRTDVVPSSNLNLVQRIKFINSKCKDGDWVLSVHGNAASNPSVRGVTTCYMHGSSYMAKKSKELSSAYSKVTGVPVWNGGAFDEINGRFGRIGMVHDTKPPALLIEAGFVTNREDMSLPPRKAAEGIASFLNRL